MKEIKITAESTEGIVQELKKNLGGEIEENWGEYTLSINNAIAKGTVRYITFDWGVSLLEYDITFFEEIILIMDASKYNPIHFAYCLKGYCGHRFGYQGKTDVKILEQYQSVIITSKKGGYNYGYFPKDLKLEINVIQISRNKFLKKRLNNISGLNNKLYEVFSDKDHQNTFAFYGSYDLKMADKIAALHKVKEKGIIRILLIQGLVYQILSSHIKMHDKFQNNERTETSLLKRELRIIRSLANKIIKEVANQYTLNQLSEISNLSQAKLQEGFKLLYGKTVTEYIRHVRLEAARDYMNTTDLNISQIVYSVGFSSRSYFSKIFKEKYQISPSDFKKKVMV
ncbi:helix-turn-helix domain-containing protein [Ascidiimonas sp. W6]|uniref:helix-turn-helix domain-containing protein n=1 Tax=Ascidiimonas meishanensis TaxID=3128903 RepID=UPI0030EE5B23